MEFLEWISVSHSKSRCNDAAYLYTYSLKKSCTVVNLKDLIEH